MKKRISLALALVPTTAAAHGPDLPIGPAELAHHWTFDPLILTGLLVVHWLYGRGLVRAFARNGRIVAKWRIASFVVGEALLVFALVSPLDPLGETLFSAHMTQHILLTTAAPMLLTLGAPAVLFAFALPAPLRKMLNRGPPRAAFSIWRRFSTPLAASCLYSLALWGWHTPALFNAALKNGTLHFLEHATFLGTALLFWSAVFARRVAPAYGALAVLVVSIESGLLGALLFLAPQTLYASNGLGPSLWGLTSLEDQQIAGLLMWAPGGFLYLAPFAVLAARALREGRSGPRDRTGIMRASTSSLSMN